MSCSQECLVILGTTVTLTVLLCAVCVMWCAIFIKCSKPIVRWWLGPDTYTDTAGSTVVTNPAAPVVIMGPIGATASKVWVQAEDIGEDPV
jgi:hypothetical protein